MEDAATAEIARAQIWQWTHHGELTLEEGRRIDLSLFDAVLADVADRLSKRELPGQSRVAQAASLLRDLTHADGLADFLTLPAYELLP